MTHCRCCPTTACEWGRGGGGAPGLWSASLLAGPQQQSALLPCVCKSCCSLRTACALSRTNYVTTPSLCACLPCRPAELAPGAGAQFSAFQQDYQLLLLARLDLQRRGLGWQLQRQGGDEDADEGAASGQLQEDLAWGDVSSQEEDAEDEEGYEEGEGTPAAAAR